MTEEQKIELKQYLKDNLTVEVYVADHSHDGPVAKMVRVVLLLDGEVINSNSNVG